MIWPTGLWFGSLKARQTLFSRRFSLCDKASTIRISLKINWRKRVRVELFRVLKTKALVESKTTSPTQIVNFYRVLHLILHIPAQNPCQWPSLVKVGVATRQPVHANQGVN